MTHREDVEKIFSRLSDRAALSPVAPGSYLVERLDEEGRKFLARSADGVNSLILVTISGAQVAPLRLTGLSVDYGTECVLIERDQRSEIRASVVRSSTELLASGDLFATFCASLIDRLPTPTTDHDLAHEVDRWSRLFWRLTQPATVAMVGLAGELLCIAEAGDVQQWVQAWHSRPEDRLDFSFLPGLATVEVKATTRDRRLHEVSLAQVDGANLDARFFASLRVVEGGHSIGDLIREIGDQLSDDHARMVLWNVLTLTCGSSLESALSFRFDYEVARASIRYYRASDIPRPTVETPLPNGVGNVRFSSDFELVDAVPFEIMNATIG